jgi:hypothetical protein
MDAIQSVGTEVPQSRSPCAPAFVRCQCLRMILEDGPMGNTCLECCSFRKSLFKICYACYFAGKGRLLDQCSQNAGGSSRG